MTDRVNSGKNKRSKTPKLDAMEARLTRMEAKLDAVLTALSARSSPTATLMALHELEGVAIERLKIIYSRGGWHMRQMASIEAPDDDDGSDAMGQAMAAFKMAQEAGLIGPEEIPRAAPSAPRRAGPKSGKPRPRRS